MKIAILCFLPAILFLSCKKSTPEETGTLKLSEVRHVDEGSGNFTDRLTYDNQDRIIKVERFKTGEAPIILGIISYQGNEMTIRQPDVQHPSATIKQQVIYTLDAQNLPLRRLALDTMFFGPPNVQRDYNTDTIDYVYDGAGLLIKKNGRGRDSSWSSGGAHKRIETRQLTAMYTNTNGNLTSYEQVLVQNFRTVENGITYNDKRSFEEAINYSYTKGHRNKIDFRHAVIFEELRMLFQEHYPINSRYLNIPNGFSTTYKQRDGNNAIVDSRTFTYQTDFRFNKSGYLEKIIYSPMGKRYTEFIYIK
jgi:hypothetical protein